MTSAGPGDAHSPRTRTGGVPLVPGGFTWPGCVECAGPMQFIAQIVLDDLAPDEESELGGTMLSVFMCQNDPGMCADWDATSGGNEAMLFPAADLSVAIVPEDGVTTLGVTYKIDYATVAADGYDDAREEWAESSGRPIEEVLGQLGGAPEWIQNDETPTCGTCGKPMTFVAQFEEGPDHQYSINFGSGCGYAFACGTCRDAAFCWQS
jgi:hypothetical protein